MAKREQIQKPAPQERKAEPTVEPATQDTAILDETDELLADIDALLDETLGEQSAQDFVAAYVQQTGQ